MPLACSIIIGVVTGAAIAGLTHLLCLGEWNGPINFATPLLAITSIALTLTAFVAKPRGWFRGLVAGLGFAAPITAVCLLIPRFIVPHLGDHSHSGDHIQQLLLVGFITLVMSSLTMAVRASGTRDSGKSAYEGR